MGDGGIRVLLVEDNEADQFAFERFVRAEKLAYDCDIVGSVAEGRDRLSRKRYDVVVADYALAGGTAFDLLGLVRGAPVIFTTGSSDEHVAARARNAGVADFLVKDCEYKYLHQLAKAIDRTLNRARPAE